MLVVGEKRVGERVRVREEEITREIALTEKAPLPNLVTKLIYDLNVNNRTMNIKQNCFIV